MQVHTVESNVKNLHAKNNETTEKQTMEKQYLHILNKDENTNLYGKGWISWETNVLQMYRINAKRKMSARGEDLRCRCYVVILWPLHFMLHAGLGQRFGIKIV